MKEHKANREFIGFTLISGLISFGYNVVMTVIPLRMVDHGLSYSKIGSAMSAVAIGLMVIKLLIGHLSDMLGTKNFILTALAGLGILCNGNGKQRRIWENIRSRTGDILPAGQCRRNDIRSAVSIQRRGICSLHMQFSADSIYSLGRHRSEE